MEHALVENKPDFVALFLENGLNLKSLLNIGELYFLYNSTRIQSDAKHAPLFQLLKKKYFDNKSSIITFYGLTRFLKDHLFKEIEIKFLPNDLDYEQLEFYLVNLVYF